jgi:hypothetical protein
MSIIVITPSRGRPEKAAVCYEKFITTKMLEATKMTFVVDADDDTFEAYIKEGLPVVTYDHEGGGMGPPMNAAALDHADIYDHIGFIGDDHLFRTQGWDEVFEKVLAEKGMVFGNDLTRKDIPTQVFMRSSIVKALGWFCLPGARHLFLDNTWVALGAGAQTLVWREDIIIEHAHPFYGRGEMDEGYARVNQPEMYEHDGALYRGWVDSGQAAKDVETVRRTLNEAEA